MTLADPLKRRRSLYQDTEKQEVEQEPQTETIKQEIPPAPIAERPVSIVPNPPADIPTPKPVQETQQLPALPYPARGLGQPSFHDRRSKVPYSQRYRKENLMLDERLVPYIYDWMETHGMNKTDAVNRAWLKVLLADGYQIDPSILDRPFRFEDLPKQT
jgi:hypothetical protein